MTLTVGEFDRIKRLGGFADELRTNEIFCDIIRGVKDDILRSWASCNDTYNREALWRDLQAVGKLEQKLKDLGEAYRAEVARMETEKKKFERLGRQREAAERG